MEIISAPYFLPMTNGAPILKNHAALVEMGKIIESAPLDELKKKHPKAEITDYPESVLMPGLVNAHCHLDMVDFEETSGTDSERNFIERIVSAIEYKHDAKPEKIILGIQKGIARLAETGTTAVGCMSHFEGIFKIVGEAGLRFVIFPEILAGQAQAAQSRFEIALALIEKYTDAAQDKIEVGLGPYAAYLLSRNLLKIISKHALQSEIELQIHAAESFAEMEFFFDSQGPIATDIFPTLGWEELPPAQRKTPVQYLAEIGFFDAPSSIIGGLHLCANDLPLLKKYLTRVIYCPTANSILKHGNFPYGKLLEFGIPMGLGTDYWIPKKGFNLWDEMRAAIARGSTPLPSGKALLQMATVGSARCLGLDHLIGTLEAGKKADYIIVRAPQFNSEEDFYSRLVVETLPHHIKRVVVNGSVLKST